MPTAQFAQLKPQVLISSLIITFPLLDPSLFRCACRIAGNKKPGAFCKAPGRKQTDLFAEKGWLYPLCSFSAGTAAKPCARSVQYAREQDIRPHRKFCRSRAPKYLCMAERPFLFQNKPTRKIGYRFNGRSIPYANGCVNPFFCRFYQILWLFFSKMHKRRSAKSSTPPPGKACGVLLLFFKEFSYAYAQFFRP